MEWITCENTYEESWRRLMEFANIELAMDAIENIHGPATKTNKANYEKQAAQARSSLLQAKEYFEAAKVSSLFTQPNHLYYGIVALSSACMLIRGDGSKSLDYLRRQPNNSSHGLDFTFSSNSKKSKIGVELLDNSFIKVCPNGHFKNWYETLIVSQPIFALKETISNEGNMKTLVVAGGFESPTFLELNNIKKSISSLLTRLPDLCFDLTRYGINVEFARGEHLITEDSVRNETINKFIFHEYFPEKSLPEITKKFKCSENHKFLIKVNEKNHTGTAEIKTTDPYKIEFPDSRTTLDHKTIFYQNSTNTPEIVDLYVISFALSMLSRYYPDIWISFLESHCKGAKLVEKVLRILMAKAPNLMLNQIMNDNIIISNHRPYWH